MTDSLLSVDSYASVDESSEAARFDFGDSLGLSGLVVVAEAVEVRIARELHDSVAQTLSTMVVHLENFKIDQSGRAGAVSTIGQLQEMAREVLDNLRGVVTDLRDEPRQDELLVARLEALLSGTFGSSGPATALRASPVWPRVLPTTISQHIYRIVAEALNNVRRHSGAGTVLVSLECTGDVLVVNIVDDGRGVEADSSGIGGSFGIKGMRERAALLGGSLELAPVTSGTGTHVRAVFPRPRSQPMPQDDLGQVG